MRKIIIDNRSVLFDEDAVLYVHQVMKEGRVYNGSYCPATTFGGVLVVWVFENKNSTRFVVQDIKLLGEV